MYYTYIIRSKKNRRYYIGSCEDMAVRLVEHNSRQVRSTKFGVPWELQYSESFQTRSEARKRELQIKSYKGGNAFKKLVNK